MNGDNCLARCCLLEALWTTGQATRVAGCGLLGCEWELSDHRLTGSDRQTGTARLLEVTKYLEAGSSCVGGLQAETEGLQCATSDLRSWDEAKVVGGGTFS